MELLVNEEKRELKSHGTFEFPVNISRKRLSSYGTGSFPWHWHDEVELTLILSGQIDYRVNDSRYLLRAGEGLFYYGDWIGTPGVAICSCNDGLRPVIFKLEATDQEAERSYTPVH